MGKIHVLLAFDDGFWAPAYAAMRGICLATRRRTDLVFQLCELGVSAAHHQDLEKIRDEFGAELVFYDLNTNTDFQTRCASLPHDTRLNTIMYARLLVEVLIPQEVERIIYFDCDTYVRAPIEELAEADLGGNPIGAVEEPHADFITNKTDMRQNRDLFDPADPYFNSGMMVIDTAKWREARVLDRLTAYVADGTMARLYFDQDLLNLIFAGKWKKLDQGWNVIDPRPVHQGLNPKMVHYTGKRRPWNLVSGVAFARIYRHVMTNELFYRYLRFRIKRRLRRWIGLK